MAGPGGSGRAAAPTRVNVAGHVVFVCELASTARAAEARLHAALVLSVAAEVSPSAVEAAAPLTLGRAGAAASGAALAAAAQKLAQRRQELVCRTDRGRPFR